MGCALYLSVFILHVNNNLGPIPYWLGRYYKHTLRAGYIYIYILILFMSSCVGGSKAPLGTISAI